MSEQSPQQKSQEAAPPSLAEKREALYQTIEKKLAIMKEVWETAQSLPVPQAEDSAEVVAEEHTKLRAVFEDIKRALPKAASAILRYEDLETAKDTASEIFKEDADKTTEADIEKGLDLFLLVDAEQKDLLEDDDSHFVISVKNGVETALEKRAAIRTVLKKVGAESLAPEAYLPLLPSSLRTYFKDSIVRVLPQRFSITFFVKPEAYIKHRRETISNGFYEPGTIWTVVKDQSWLTPEKRIMHSVLGGEPKDLYPQGEKRLQETLQHEDLHAFIERFALRDPASLSVKSIQGQIESIKNMKSAGARRIVLEDSLETLRRWLNRFMDYGHEELVAEFASLPHKQIPSRTFAARLRNLTDVLGMEEGKDPDVDKIIKEAALDLDLKKFRSRLQNLYTAVEEHAPEKIKELDMALTLFPPSKIRQVERLVKRWVEK